MRILLTLIMMVSLFSNAVFAGQIGSSAPPFSLKNMKGEDVALDTLNGKVLLLTFWAPWCASCKTGMQQLEKLRARYAADGLEVVGIAVGASRRTTERFLRDVPVSFTVLLDDGLVSDVYQCSHLPTTVIIDRDGIIRDVHKGFAPGSRDAYEEKIKEFLHMVK